jgi:hypothetical protein
MCFFGDALRIAREPAPGVSCDTSGAGRGRSEWSRGTRHRPCLSLGFTAYHPRREEVVS